ncbi:hypothetical protein cypCar_00006444 [Cyprinus carpio]|nr:hypothetical protein cypCar_00006444 [Cyprinus carpio]
MNALISLSSRHDSTEMIQYLEIPSLRDMETTHRRMLKDKVWIYFSNITTNSGDASYTGYNCHFSTEHKVIIVGLDNAGKTTILYQFSMNEVVHTSPTIGSNVEEIVVNNTHFLMWDIGGQESLRSSWNTYYTNTEDLKKAGLLIFANKQDVKGCMTVAEISQSLQLTSVKDHQWHIQACCALTGEGREDVMSHRLCKSLLF